MDYFDLSHERLGSELRHLHRRAVHLLATKDVEYTDLRSALVPSARGSDVALVFEADATESGAYGMAIAESVLPLLDREWRGSILQGDLIPEDQDRAFDLLRESLQLARSVNIRNTAELYAVYLSNLTPARTQRLLAGLRRYPPFVGHIPATHASPCKTWLGVTLVNSYVKHGDTFICGHEDDRDDAENVNMHWWPVEAHNYRIVSLPDSLYFHPFLAFKIERAVHPAFASDTLHALSAVSPLPRPLDDLDVQVGEAKLDYLRKAKAGVLEVAGLEGVTEEELRLLILEKLQSNHIYELEYVDEYDVTKFSVLIEVPGRNRDRRVRLRVVLAYEPLASRLRLLTMY